MLSKGFKDKILFFSNASIANAVADQGPKVPCPSPFFLKQVGKKMTVEGSRVGFMKFFLAPKFC